MDQGELDEAIQAVMGWNQYKAAAYQVLVRHGPLAATDVAVRADVPKGRVYDVLNELDSEGAVRTQGAQPKQYHAQSPRKIISEEQSSFEEMAEVAKRDLGAAYEVSEGSVSRHSAWVLTGLAGIRTRMREILDDVESRVLMLESDPWFKAKDFERLDELADQGVDVRVVLWNARQRHVENVDDGAQFQIRENADVSSSFYLVDESQVVINIGRGQTGIVFEDATIANIFTKRFEEIYESATEVDLQNA